MSPPPPLPTPSDDAWLTRHEAASYARVSVSTIDRARRHGHLQWTKPDGRVLIRRRWVDRWLAAGATVALVTLLLSLLLVWATLCEIDALHHVVPCPHHHL